MHQSFASIFLTVSVTKSDSSNLDNQDSVTTLRASSVFFLYCVRFNINFISLVLKFLLFQAFNFLI